MANYPQELAQDTVCQSHTGHMIVLWFLPSPAFKVEYEWMNEWIESINASTSEFIARRKPAANILTTNSVIPLFCRLLWTQNLNL